MPTPHASWAHCYDFAYENSHGQLYQSLTNRTLDTIKALGTPSCRAVDFGAGTGRLAVPLAQLGYKVTAVEPCQEMMDVLLSKARAANVEVQSRVATMQDFDGRGEFDLALCVFTTVLYLLDDDSLSRGLIAFANSLKKGGRLLIDIPSRHAFRSYQTQTPVLDRQVTVTPAGGDIYNYQEHIRCQMDGGRQECKDSFQIRYWPTDTVLSVIRGCGVDLDGPIHGFQGIGADYYRGTKAR